MPNTVTFTKTTPIATQPKSLTSMANFGFRFVLLTKSGPVPCRRRHRGRIGLIANKGFLGLFQLLAFAACAALSWVPRRTPAGTQLSPLRFGHRQGNGG